MLVLKKFTLFTGKPLLGGGVFYKVTVLKRIQHRCFHVNNEKFLRTAFLIEHLGQLLLKECHL